MKRRSLLLGLVLTMALGATPALADTAKTVTATGTGQSRVVPKNRNNNASIVAAVDAARKASVRAAINQAHEYATQYAKAIGLTLGAATSVSDAQNGGFFYGPGPGGPFGSFGPNQYCGTVQQPVFKVVKGRRKVVRTKKVHRCFVPRFAFVTVTVTYAAS